jgi:CIC family chloride channel protein
MKTFWLRMRRHLAWAEEGGGAREGQLFLFLAVVIGLFGGLSVVLFRMAIEWTKLLAFGSVMNPPWTRLLLVPTVGGLIVAYLVVRFFPRARGSGVNQTKAAVYIFDGYIPFNTVVGKFITCAMAIGTGQSLGPEDPSLQIGAGIASALGRRLQLSREKVRLIAPVGAAAGLAAAFNAPISAVLFVIEEVIGNWNAGVLGAIVLSAVSSVIVSRWFLGDQALFGIPAYHLVHPAELLAYALLGVIGGVFSLAFVKLVAYARPRLKALPRWTQYLQPAAAGLLIGVIGLGLPQVMGAGYDFIDQAMHDQFTWQFLLLLAIFKVISTSASFVSGTPGGMFAPTLFIGAMLGGAIGGLERHFFPWLHPGIGAYALVGMGTLFAGFLRVPLTSVFMVLEVSGNYSIILPVMISNTIAYLISRQYQNASLFDLLSRQDGMDLPSMDERREEVAVHVEDAMRPYEGLILKMDDPLKSVVNMVQGSPETYLLLEDGLGKWYGIPREELDRLTSLKKEEETLRTVLVTDPLPHLHPDHALDEALRRLGDNPVLPVVNRADIHKLEGVVGLKEILSAFRNSDA